MGGAAGFGWLDEAFDEEGLSERLETDCNATYASQLTAHLLHRNLSSKRSGQPQRLLLHLANSFLPVRPASSGLRAITVTPPPSSSDDRLF